MKAVVMAYSGVQKKGVPTPDSVNTSVIPTDRYPNAALVLDYSTALNKSTVPSSGTYDNIIFNVTKTSSDYITVGGDTVGCNIVFYVDTAVNVTITQRADSQYDVVLVDECGRSLWRIFHTATTLSSQIHTTSARLSSRKQGSRDLPLPQ